jgi:hypothetical protein
LGVSGASGRQGGQFDRKKKLINIEHRTLNVQHRIMNSVNLKSTEQSDLRFKMVRLIGLKLDKA